MLKKPVTSKRSPRTKRLSTIAFVAWSASTTAAASANHRQALSIGPALARPAEIELAASAERFVIHIRPVMPAALALALLARPDFHPQLSRSMHARRRGEHHELEIVAEPREPLVVRAVGIEIRLRLQ